MNQQLTLSIALNQQASFDNFCWGNNGLLQQQLIQLGNNSGESFLYVWGEAACGKSHLLQALCQSCPPDTTAIYLPLKEVVHWGSDALHDLEQQHIVALDDIDSIAGIQEWEEALFHLYNRIRANPHCRLVLTASRPPSQLAIALPDLSSRLSWGLCMQVQALNDELKASVLQKIAEQRGIQLPIAIANFLVQRCSRSLHDLIQALDSLDRASLAEKRKITLPFVKRVLKI